MNAGKCIQFSSEIIYFGVKITYVDNQDIGIINRNRKGKYVISSINRNLWNRKITKTMYNAIVKNHSKCFRS